VGLALGLVAGLQISAAAAPALHWLASLVEPVGVVWVNLLKMKVLPLIVSPLVTSIASASDF
jgi:proton glutamate symport protein